MNDQASMPHWLAQQVEIHPQKVVLQYKTRSWTYAELADEVRIYANGLLHAGVEPGAYVGLLSPNNPELIFTALALQWIGGITVHLNQHLTAEEIKFQVENAGCQTVITRKNNTEGISAISQINQVFSFEDISAESAESSVKIDTKINPDMVCSIFHTSGTTGVPKGVPLTYRNFLASAVASGLNLGVQQEDYWLAPLPLDHIGGFSILMRSLIYGTTMYLQDQFDEVAVKDILENKPVTMISLVPTMLQRLMKAEFTGTANLRVILLGGAPATRELMREAMHLRLPVYRTYGMTETCSQIVTMNKPSTAETMNSSGSVLPLHEIEIRNNSGDRCTTSTTGEIFVRGPAVTSGYLNQDDTNERLFTDGWFQTGDFGYLNKHGHLYTVSRRENLIITGGENVYPEEVEQVLETFPGIREAAVYGIPDAEWGELVAAAVIPEKGESLSTKDISTFLTSRLAKFKQPKQYFVVRELPRTATGKIQRGGLEEWVNNCTT